MFGMLIKLMMYIYIYQKAKIYISGCVYICICIKNVKNIKKNMLMQTPDMCAQWAQELP